MAAEAAEPSPTVRLIDYLSLRHQSNKVGASPRHFSGGGGGGGLGLKVTGRGRG